MMAFYIVSYRLQKIKGSLTPLFTTASHVPIFQLSKINELNIFNSEKKISIVGRGDYFTTRSRRSHCYLDELPYNKQEHF